MSQNIQIDIDKMIILQLLYIYRNLDYTSYNVKQEWDSEYIVTDKEIETVNSIDIAKQNTLNTIHVILTGELYSGDLFAENVSSYFRINTDSVDVDDFIKSLDFYLKRVRTDNSLI